jgi:hypothetical protein
MLATFTSMLLVSMTLAQQPDDPPPPPPPPGPPGPADVKVEWEAGYPKKEGGKLKLKGKVTFANGWGAFGGFVEIYIFPKNGGAADKLSQLINPDGTWEEEIELNKFPMPPKEYDINSFIMAWKGKNTLSYKVFWPRETKLLP